MSPATLTPLLNLPLILPGWSCIRAAPPLWPRRYEKSEPAMNIHSWSGTKLNTRRKNTLSLSIDRGGGGSGGDGECQNSVDDENVISVDQYSAWAIPPVETLELCCGALFLWMFFLSLFYHFFFKNKNIHPPFTSDHLSLSLVSSFFFEKIK